MTNVPTALVLNADELVISMRDAAKNASDFLGALNRLDSPTEDER